MQPCAELVAPVNPAPYRPRLHGRHSSAVVAPTVGLNVPDRQRVHSVRPATFVNEPAGHTVQALASLVAPVVAPLASPYFPTGHMAHADNEPEPGINPNLPIGHAAHAPTEGAPLCTPYRPSVQFVHAFAIEVNPAPKPY